MSDDNNHVVAVPTALFEEHQKDAAMHRDGIHVPELNSDLTHVTTTQLEIDLDCVGGSVVSDVAAHITTSETTIPGTSLKLITRPATDNGPHDQGFCFAAAKPANNSIVFKAANNGTVIAEGQGASSKPPRPPSFSFGRHSTRPNEQSMVVARMIGTSSVQPSLNFPLNIPESVLKSFGQKASPPGSQKVTDDFKACSSENLEHALVKSKLHPSDGPLTVTAVPENDIMISDQGLEDQVGQNQNTDYGPELAQHQYTQEISVMEETGVQQEVRWETFQALQRDSHSRNPSKAFKKKKKLLKKSRACETNRSNRLLHPERDGLEAPSGDPSQEDIVNVLLFKVQQDREVHEAEKAAFEIGAAEFAQLGVAYNSLNAQFNTLEHNSQQQQTDLAHCKQQFQQRIADITTLKETLSNSQGKVDQLEITISRLIENNGELKAEANVMRNLSEDAKNERFKLAEALTESRVLEIRIRAEHAELIAGLRGEINKLEKECLKYKQSMEHLQEANFFERQRSDTQQDKLSEVAADQKQVLQKCLEGKNAMIAKLDTLHTSLRQDQSTEISQKLNEMSFMIEECMATFGEGTPQASQAQHIANVNVAIYGYAKTLNKSIEKAVERSHSLSAETQKHTAEIIARIDTVACRLQREQELNGEIRGLSLDLVDANKKISTITAKEEMAQAAAARLTKELAEIEPNPQDIPRLQLLEIEKNAIQSELDQLKVKTIEESANLESAVNQKLEKLRLELVSAGHLETARKKAKADEIIREANSRNEVVNCKVNNLENQVELLESEVKRLKQHSNTLTAEKLFQLEDWKDKVADYESQIADMGRLYQEIADHKQHCDSLSQSLKDEKAVADVARQQLTDRDTELMEMTGLREAIENSELSCIRLRESLIEEKSYNDVVREKLSQCESKIEEMTRLQECSEEKQTRFNDLHRALSDEKAQKEAAHKELADRQDEVEEMVRLRRVVEENELRCNDFQKRLARKQAQSIAAKKEVADRDAETNEIALIQQTTVEHEDLCTSLKDDGTKKNTELAGLKATILKPRLQKMVASAAAAEEESQELINPGLAPKESNTQFVQEESHDSMGTRRSSERADEQHFPLTKIMRDTSQASPTMASSSNKRRKVNRKQSQGILWVIEESQIYRRSVTEGNLLAAGPTHPKPSLSPANSGSPFQMPVSQHDLSFDRIQELTSPVGDTRALFPSTPVRPSIHRSNHSRGVTSPLDDHMNGDRFIRATVQRPNKFGDSQAITTQMASRKEPNQYLKRKPIGHSKPSSNTSCSRTRKTAQDYGPIIVNHQSPEGYCQKKQVGQARKSTCKKSGDNDKFARRFYGEE